MNDKSPHTHEADHSHSHDHHHHHHHHHHHGSGNLTAAFLLNLVFTVIEIIGGIYTNSVAILSDAVHDLGDSVALLFAIIMERVSRRGINENLTFGYKRFSILGALVNSIILMLGSVFVLYRAFNRLFHVEEVHVEGMIIMAVGGVIFNGLAVFKLYKEESMNSRVVFLHLLEDILGWGAILVISIVMLFVDLPILDPILSIVIAFFILSRIIPSLMKVLRIFLQYRPDDVEVQALKESIEKIDDVQGVHDIHLWSLDGGTHIFSCHVLIEDSSSVEKIILLKQEIKGLLKEKGIHHATIEPELSSEVCPPCEL